MTATIANVNRYAAGAHVYVFAATPADAALMTHAAGVPTGYATREVGATIGVSTFEYRPSIALTDIEQYFGQVAPRLTAETATLKVALAEASVANLEMALQQGQVSNILSLYNSSFETDSNSDGLADSWAKIGGATVTTIQTAHALTYGTKSQRFVPDTGVPGGVVSVAVAHPRLVPGAVALFSAYVKSVSATPTATFKIEAFDSSDVSQGSNTATLTLSVAFARGSVAYTLPATTAYVKVSVEDVAGQDIGFDIDQAQLEVVATTSVAPQVYNPHRGIFVGGRTGVDTYTVVLMSKQTDTAFYNWVCLYSAFVSEGAAIAFKRGEVRQVPVTFYGLPVTTRTAGDQTFQMVEEK